MLTPEQVDHIAKLARLSITPEEREQFALQLSSVLDYVGSLSDVPTDNVEPMQHVADVHNVFGVDQVVSSDPATRTALIALFPEREQDLLKVKAVFS